MQKNVFFTLLFAFSILLGESQVSINLDGSPADSSAILDVQSSSKGVLLPRLTQAQMTSVANPANGLMIICTNCNSDSTGCLVVFLDGFWRIVNTDCLYTGMNPESGVHDVSQTEVVWKWSPTPEALGFKWNTTNNYSTAINVGSSLFKVETGLICNRTYTRYIWAYNSCGYSKPTTLNATTLPCPAWSCGNPFIDERDGRQYNTIQIGAQCWMKENLNYGTLIPKANYQLDNEIPEKYCYDDIEQNCNTYGGCYQWGELVQYLNGASNTTTWNPPPSGPIQGLCPAGWHLPTEPEWCTLTTYIDPTVNCSAIDWSGTNVGGKMKEIGTAHWYAPNNGATNESGFTALPGGYDMRYLGYYAMWWSITEQSPNSGFERALYNSYVTVSRNISDKTTGLSVRCLKD